MLRRHKNGFIEVIRKHGFSPSSFKRIEKLVDGNPAFILQLRNTPMSFMTRTSSEDFHGLDIRCVRFAPNYPMTDYYPELNWTNIEDIYERFGVWLDNDVTLYLEEIDAPDLWEQIESGNLFEDDPLLDQNKAEFGKVEKERIRGALEQFQQSVEEEFSPSEEQSQAVRDRLDYLSEALDRLNKTDWQGVAISAIVSISVALSLDTEQGKRLFELFKSALSSVARLMSQ